MALHSRHSSTEFYYTGEEMSKNIWVTSDSHLFHANILNFIDYNGNQTRPGFANVDEMNEKILDHWNQVVKPGDKVYTLGDVVIGDHENFKKLWPKFNGSKNLIVGNHDDIKFLSAGGFFKKVTMWRMMPEFGLLLTHVPVHQSSLYRGDKELKNCHGHIHSMDSPPGPYVNVCVEKTDYFPVNIEELRQW